MNKLALVGSHSTTCKNAPFDDAAYDIMVFNEAPLAEWCKRWDICVQIHKEEVYSALNNWVNPDYWAWMQQDHPGKVIYLHDVDKRVPNSKRYPLNEIFYTVPGGKFKDIESGPSYGLALALYLGYEHIEVYGVELTSNTEYSYQLPDWKFWVGVTLGMGVDLILKSGEVHFQSRLYGYEGEVQIEKPYYLERVAKLETAWQEADKKLTWTKGKVNDAINNKAYDKLRELVMQYQENSIKAGEYAGALAEAEKYANEVAPIARQQFEKRAAQSQRDGEGIRALMYNSSGKVEYVYNVWIQNGNYTALQQLRQFIQEQMKHAYDVGGHMGVYQENVECITQYDARLTAAGGNRTLSVLLPELAKEASAHD